jgi:hypothetical protein
MSGMAGQQGLGAERDRLSGDVGSGTSLVADRYAADFSRPLPRACFDLTCYAARDTLIGSGGAGHDPQPALMAVLVPQRQAARAHALAALGGAGIDGLLAPFGHGTLRAPAGPAYAVITPAPPGPVLFQPGFALPEAVLVGKVLRPVAAVLRRLVEHGVTHRAIAPANLFAAPGRAVLGAAWAAPPASHQPPGFEPPYMEACLPEGRGEGTIADDVYALGVTLLALALGRMPWAEVEPGELLRRKLLQGSLPALLGEARLPSGITELISGMLAEDPEHRPTPAQLVDAQGLRARRVALRPQRRAARPLAVARMEVFEARFLAHAIAESPAAGAALLRGGEVGTWLRRQVGDTALAKQLEDRLAAAGTEDGAGEAMMVMRAVAVLDPLAPLCWRGLRLFPDALGAVAAAASGMREAALDDLVRLDAIHAWAEARGGRGDPTAFGREARQLRLWHAERGWAGGIARLRYALVPLLPCRSPLLASTLVVSPAELLEALELAARRAGAAQASPVDREIGAFLAARGDGRPAAELAALAAGEREAALVPLRLLARLMPRRRGSDLGSAKPGGAKPSDGFPALAAWLVARARPAVEALHSRARRESLASRIAVLVEAGDLPGLLAALDDDEARQSDSREAALVASRQAVIEAEIAALVAARGGRRAWARATALEAVQAAAAGGIIMALAMTLT